MTLRYMTLKRLITLGLGLTLLMFVTSYVLAQVPPSFMIQGLAQDVDGIPLVDQEVNVSVTLDGIPLDHEPTVFTSSAGVFKLEVTAVDIFDLLQTGTGFLEVTVEGIPLSTPLLSVPYAMIAEQVVNDQVDDEDPDPTNELQELAFADGKLSITGGNEISIPTGETDADADPTNELQTLSFENGTLTISDGNEVTIPAGGEDADADPTNELQTLAFSNGVLSISDGNEINIPTGGTDADADPTNELQELSLQGNVLTIVGPGEGDASITLPDGGGGNSPWVVDGNDISYSDGQVIIQHSNSNSVVMDAIGGDGRIAVLDEDNEVMGQLISNGTRNDPQGSFGYLELFGPNGNSNIILGFVGTNTEQDRGGIGIYNESDEAWWMSPGATNDPDLGLYFLNGNNFDKVGEFSRTNGNYSALSDFRAKSDIENLPGLLDQVQRLRPVSYYYKHSKSDRKDIGFIAQEVQQVFPALVTDMDGKYGLNYTGFSVLAIKAVQEIAQENDDLKEDLSKAQEQLSAQQDLISQLLSRVEALENQNK